MVGGLESRCVSRVCGADGAVRLSRMALLMKDGKTRLKHVQHLTEINKL